MISIGCKLTIPKSNHLFAPLTSRPIIGTKINKNKENKKKGITDFFKNLISIKEIKSIRVIAIDA